VSFISTDTNSPGQFKVESTNGGALAFTLPGDWKTDITLNFTLTNPVVGQTFRISGVSGGLVTVTNEIAHSRIVTNTVWASAGAMAPGGSTTADGGRSGAAPGSFTNGSFVSDVYLMDDSANECVTFTFQPGYGFAGDITTTLYWVTTNSLIGATNVVWDAGVSLLSSNELFTANVYQTNGTYRFWSSNTVQVAKLPQITIASGVTPDTLLAFRFSRLGTNTADAALGDAMLLGARVAFTTTNSIGGYP
jgi:hypothetical protein